MNPNDLTEAVARARTGVMREVGLFCSLLDSHALVLPLAQPVPGEKAAAAAVRTAGPDGASIQLHLVSGPKGEKICPMFTEDSILSRVGRHFGWTTGGGPLEMIQLGAKSALELALDMAGNGAIAGSVINPFDKTALDLTPEELRDLLRSDQRALRRRLRDLPIQKNEQFITREPSQPLPELARALEAVLAVHPELVGYTCVEVVSAERDQPVLLVSLQTRGDVDQGRIAEEAARAVEGKYPASYENLDLMFTSAARASGG